MATSAALRSAVWMDGVTFAAQDARLATVSALLIAAGSSGSTGLAARAGVRPGVGTPLLVSAASGMNVTVNNGIAFVQGTAALDAGLYPVVLDTATTLTVTAADPSNPRIDNVCLTLVDNGNNTSTYVVQIQAGTPASSPAAPALAANSLLLAAIAVGAGVTSIVAGNITDQRLFTVAPGGILPVASSAQYPGTGQESQYLHDATTHRLRRLDGAGGTTAPLTAPFAAVSTQVTTLVTCTSNTVKVLVAQVAVTVDGATKVKISASWPYLVANTANIGDEVMILLYRDSTQIKQLLQFRAQSANNNMDGHAFSAMETPAAGTHTYGLYLLNFGAGKSFSMAAGAGFPIDLSVEPAPL
jgi:hypothetical protein